ncbi:MAG: hypothetical protein KDM91_14130 [Verrucomicrobiae bacterium]|nr:hypothetical protein [Verrucomicrobiae bacterium]
MVENRGSVARMATILSCLGGFCAAPAQDLITPPVFAEKGIQALNPGPWGDLEYYVVNLEPPDNLIGTARDIDAHVEGTVWKFVAHTPEMTADTLTDAGLAPDAVARLTGDDHLRVNGAIVEIRPPEDLVESLAPQIRARLYPRIGRDIEGNVFRNFYLIPPGGIRSLAGADSGLSDRTLDLIERLTYPVEGVRAFSDIALAMRRAADETERRRILKTLLREKSFALRLKVSSAAEIEDVARYWTARGRNLDVLPMLKTIAINSEVQYLDIVHLLPPTPRKLIHTYPRRTMSVGWETPDCYWTAFNFFAYAPSNRHFDAAVFASQIQDRYEPATKPWQLGDLVLISDADTGKAIHVCSYIADNLVLTKNGKGFYRPWVVSPLFEVTASYARVKRLAVHFLRQKPRPKTLRVRR